MPKFSDLPLELLHLCSLHLGTSDCSSLSSTCWKSRNAVIPVLFKSIRIIDEYAGDIAYLFDECHHIKPVVRNITLIQWDSDFVSATLSTDIIYHGVASFPNLRSLGLFINTNPHLCWMHRLHRIFLSLRNHQIRKLQVEIAGFADSSFESMPEFLDDPPLPYYCLTNLTTLHITVKTVYAHPLHMPLPWVDYFDRLMLANKATLTTLFLDVARDRCSNFMSPFTLDPLFEVLQKLKQLEILTIGRVDPELDDRGYFDESLALAQPDICPKLRQINWDPGWVPSAVFITQGYDRDLPSESDSDDSDYEPSSLSSGSDCDYDSDLSSNSSECHYEPDSSSEGLHEFGASSVASSQGL
ncbi:hypothetical protein AB1N83_008946 [Pleurotus pulmonarius]